MNYSDIKNELQVLQICFMQFGDASGIQSPVSFGGFGSLTRHLGRLSTGEFSALLFSNS